MSIPSGRYKVHRFLICSSQSKRSTCLVATRRCAPPCLWSLRIVFVFPFAFSSSSGRLRGSYLASISRVRRAHWVLPLVTSRSTLRERINWPIQHGFLYRRWRYNACGASFRKEIVSHHNVGILVVENQKGGKGLSLHTILLRKSFTHRGGKTSDIDVRSAVPCNSSSTIITQKVLPLFSSFAPCF